MECALFLPCFYSYKSVNIIRCIIMCYKNSVNKITRNACGFKIKPYLCIRNSGCSSARLEYASGGNEMSFNRQEYKSLNIKELSCCLTPFLLPTNKFRLKFSGNLVQIKANCRYHIYLHSDFSRHCSR